MVRLFHLVVPGVVLLGAGGFHSLAAPPAPEAVAQQSFVPLSPTDQNWHAFWNQHLGDWQGRWTRYTPSGEITETFQSTRSFTSDLPRTAIEQVNSYVFPDGRRVQKRWSYNRQEHSLTSGFAHPASASMRGLAFPNGAAAWLIPAPTSRQLMPFEFFLKQGDVRHSVGVVYGKDGRLVRTASIREGLSGFPGQFWTDGIDQEAPWRVEGDWVGQGELIRADLSRSSLANRLWTPMADSRSLHFLPDKIILQCPERIQSGKPFTLKVVWMIDSKKMQSIAAEYDQNKRLVGVTHRTWKPQS